ncbi:hypothetical protein OG897_36510 [Streptomyces sp. NBC_00237]|uniref:hypothetical protein n=1 Tax=Streptomyces sp. NBC_00237 TaxID=2975687 RepID=UPI00225BBFD1|nr:hypothetical protein [Streptomyces sp. NBC_00237]MCX5206891.1 hypothetical protein [Streptomyces sp. NBC_00237]
MRKVVALGAFKGAPGVTTLAMALAAAWPAESGVRPVVVEADVAGGDLAARFGLSDMEGLLALAAGAHRDGEGDELDGCVQEVAGGLRLVLAPTGGDQASASIGEVVARPSVLRGGDGNEGTVLLDLGRLGARPSRELARGADRLVLVSRGSVEALAHVAARGEWLEGASYELVVVGPCRFSEADIAAALEVSPEQVHKVPWDVRAAAVLSGDGQLGRRRWVRSSLTQAASALAHHLDGAGSGRPARGLGSELAQLLPVAMSSRSGAARALSSGGGAQ